MSVNRTHPSSRFCPNYQFNTQGLFSHYFNENSSLHCGQEKIEFPNLQKMCNGCANGVMPKVNNQVTYYPANTQPIAFNEQSGTNFTNSRQVPVISKFDMNGRAATKPNGEPVFTNTSGNKPQHTREIREKWGPARTGFTTELAPDEGMTSATVGGRKLADGMDPEPTNLDPRNVAELQQSTRVKTVNLPSVRNERMARNAKEKFKSAIKETFSTPTSCCCSIIIIVVIVILFFIMFYYFVMKCCGCSENNGYGSSYSEKPRKNEIDGVAVI